MLIELVNDDPNKKVESEKASKNNEGNKVNVVVEAVFKAGLVIELNKKGC